MKQWDVVYSYPSLTGWSPTYVLQVKAKTREAAVDKLLSTRRDAEVFSCCEVGPIDDDASGLYRYDSIDDGV